MIATEKHRDVVSQGAGFMTPPGTTSLDHGKVLAYHEANERVLLQDMVDADPTQPHRLANGMMGWVPA